MTFTGNVAFDDGAAKQKYGLSIPVSSTITAAELGGNNFTGNTTQPLLIAGTITGIFGDNAGMPAPTISGCSATSPTGNGNIGKYTSGTTGSCAVTVTPYGTSNIKANNGWVGSAFDATTTADIQTQTASTQTSATFTGTTVSADVINFSLRSW